MIELKGFIEEQLSVWEVPGCAVAAIKDGEVVFAEGFGQADREGSRPVTEATLFPIGSTTKAFTAASVGALVDDGLLEWEKPVREYIPGFQMHDPVATERLTPRDLLSHNSGLPRHEFVWLGHSDRSRADLVSRLRHLPLSADIRQRWQYCNLGYITVGYLVEILSGMAWEDFVATRLLKPLGMERSNFSIEALQASDDFSKPYEKRGDEVVEIPFRVMDNVGPAGTINSCASEMASWLKMNLGAASGAEQAVSLESLKFIQSPQALVPEATQFPEISAFAYGFGWIVGQYRGMRHVHHNGGVDGFYTDVMLVPEHGAAVFVVNNRLVPLGRALGLRVLDEILDLEPIDWSSRYKEILDAAEAGAKEVKAAARKVEGARPLRDLKQYAGEYAHPGYGTIKLISEGDKLVPEFGSLELHLVHRHYDVFDLEWKELSEQVSFVLTFLTGADGEVEALSVPFEPTVDPIRFDRVPEELSPELLESLVGQYEMGPLTMEVAVRESTVTITVVGQAPTELEAQRGLRFSVKGSPGISVEFVMDNDVVEKVVIDPGGVFTPKPVS